MIEFVLDVTLMDGGMISVLLPGFTRPVQASNPLEQSIDLCFDNSCKLIRDYEANATWDETDSRLSLMGVRVSRAHVEVKIIIAKAPSAIIYAALNCCVPMVSDYSAPERRVASCFTLLLLG